MLIYLERENNYVDAMIQKMVATKADNKGITIRTDTKAGRQQGNARMAPIFFMGAGLALFFAIDSGHQESLMRTEKVASDVAIVQNYVDTGTNKLAALDAVRDLKLRDASDIASNLVVKATDWDFENTASLILGNK